MARIAATKIHCRRGNALMLAVLILLSLTAVGVISVQLTNTDLLVSGNLTRSSQADSVGRAGAAHGMVLVGVNPGYFIQAFSQWRTNQFGGAAAGVTKTKELGGNILRSSTSDPDPTNNPDPLGDNLQVESSNNATAHMPKVEFGAGCANVKQEVAYDVKATVISESRATEGQSTKADICFTTLDFNARGGIPTAQQPAATTLEQEDTVVVRNRARGMAGPLQCRVR
jgi:hypothetical protein